MRQFIAETELDSRGCLEVADKKFHYMRNVLRVIEGNMISVRLPDGTLQQMTVASVDEKKKIIVLQVAGAVQKQNDLHASPAANTNSVDLWLFQFVAKPAKMELIVRQAVECGVSVIVPVAGTFCQSGAVTSAKEAAMMSGKGGRWDRIITEAREQSGSAVNTRIENCVSVADAVTLWKSVQEESKKESCAVVLYEQIAGTVPLHLAVGRTLAVRNAAVAVGAEGGISPNEIEIMQMGGFVPVHFATNILRCETAALYGIATLQTALMENDIWQNRE
jgi:16S rRNA (uracil1498-N3)-methyltransferase